MAYSLRPFKEFDADALAQLTLAAIRTIATQKYSAEQVEAWAARHPDAQRFIERARAGSQIIGAVDGEGRPVAYALLEPDGHLDMLYCHPHHSGRGLANELLAAVEQQARGMSLRRLYTEASELARPAFERAGYTVTHRRDFEIAHDGRSISIHNYAMEKPLD